jgi:hypothetical protein
MALTVVSGCVQRAPDAVVPAAAQSFSETAISPNGGVQETRTRYPLLNLTFTWDRKVRPLLLGASPSFNAFVSIDPNTGHVLGTFPPPVLGSATVASPYGLASFFADGKPFVLFTPQIGESALVRLALETDRRTILRASYCRFAGQLAGGIALDSGYYYPYYGQTEEHIVDLVGGDLFKVSISRNNHCTTSLFFHDPLPNPRPFSIVYNEANHNVDLGDLNGHIFEIAPNHKLIKDYVLPGAGTSSIGFPTAMIYVPALHGIAFENPYDSTIGGITRSGKMIHVHVSTMGSGTTPNSMTLGSDGTIWAAGGGDSFFRITAGSSELKYGAGYRVVETTSSTAPALTGIVTIPITPTEYKVYATDSKNPFAFSIDFTIKH